MDLFDILVAGKLFGGGGNPNEIITINGTVDNPFGEYSSENIANEIAEGIGQNEINAYIVVDGTALGVGSVTMQFYGDNPYTLYAGTVDLQSNASDVTAAQIAYNRADSSLNFARMFVASTVMDISPYASNLPTVLTIVSHPID